VEYYSNAWVFRKADDNKKNPGVVLTVRSGKHQQNCTVLWANDTITDEHQCYLHRVNS